MRRLGAPRMLIAGLVLIMLSLLGMSQLDANSAYAPDVLVPFLLLGLGAGLAFLPLMTLAMADVPHHRRRPGVRHRQRVAADLGGDRDRGARDDRHRPRAVDLHDGSGLGHALTAGYTLAWELGAPTVLAGIVVAADAAAAAGRRRRACAGGRGQALEAA